MKTRKSAGKADVAEDPCFIPLQSVPFDVVDETEDYVTFRGEVSPLAVGDPVAVNVVAAREGRSTNELKSDLDEDFGIGLAVVLTGNERTDDSSDKTAHQPSGHEASDQEPPDESPQDRVHLDIEVDLSTWSLPGSEEAARLVEVNSAITATETRVEIERPRAMVARPAVAMQLPSTKLVAAGKMAIYATKNHRWSVNTQDPENAYIRVLLGTAQLFGGGERSKPTRKGGKSKVLCGKNMRVHGIAIKSEYVFYGSFRLE